MPIRRSTLILKFNSFLCPYAHNGSVLGLSEVDYSISSLSQLDLVHQSPQKTISSSITLHFDSASVHLLVSAPLELSKVSALCPPSVCNCFPFFSEVSSPTTLHLTALVFHPHQLNHLRVSPGHPSNATVDRYASCHLINLALDYTTMRFIFPDPRGGITLA